MQRHTECLFKFYFDHVQGQEWSHFAREWTDLNNRNIFAHIYTIVHM